MVDNNNSETDVSSVSSDTNSHSESQKAASARHSKSSRRGSIFGHQSSAFVSSMSKLASVMDFEVHKLQEILSQPLCCSAFSQYMHLEEKYKLHQGQFPRGVLEDITLSLHEIVDCSLDMPLSADGILFCHETLGIAHYLLGDYESSIMSFMKAMWIHMKKSSFANHSKMNLHNDGSDSLESSSIEGNARYGLLQHRLATVYNETGQLRPALFCFEKAQHIYEETGLSKSNPIFNSAEQSISQIKELLDVPSTFHSSRRTSSTGTRKVSGLTDASSTFHSKRRTSSTSSRQVSQGNRCA